MAMSFMRPIIRETDLRGCLALTLPGTPILALGEDIANVPVAAMTVLPDAAPCVDHRGSGK